TGLAMSIALIAALTLLPQLLIAFKPFGPEVEESKNHLTPKSKMDTNETLGGQGHISEKEEKTWHTFR
ncbi:MAG: hypothetical protein KJO34_03040, partial [Deltaproteobacteria bacterium]|nr:hypothetical protein [Deltaproteobacteria bacterium]